PDLRPGTIEEMGFGYDVFKALNPRLIMVNVSAYGQFGPYREQIGYDPIGQTMSGIPMVTGEEGMPSTPPRRSTPLLGPWRHSTSGPFLARGRPSMSAWRTRAIA